MRKLLLFLVPLALLPTGRALAGCVGLNGACTETVPLVHANVDVGADHVLASGGLDSGPGIGPTGVIVDATGPLVRVMANGSQAVGPTGVIVDFTGPTARVFFNGGQLVGSTGVRPVPGGFAIYANGNPVCTIAIGSSANGLSTFQICSVFIGATGVTTTGNGTIQIWISGSCRAGVHTQPPGLGC